LKFRRLLIFLPGSLLALSLLNLPGMEDVGAWLDWMRSVDQFGVVEGYRAQRWDYPPLTYVILFGVVRLAQLFNLTPFLALKLSLLVFIGLTLLSFWLWTKNLALTALLQLTLLLNSVALGYLDLYFAPTLIFSLLALKNRRPFLFTLLFCITCLIKWQPLIISPFLLIYLLDIKLIFFIGAGSPHSGSRFGQNWARRPRPYNVMMYFIESAKSGGLIGLALKDVLQLVVLPFLVIVVVLFSVWGLEPLRALHLATLDPLLSGNALNFNWILTHLLHLFYPGNFGGLTAGQAGYIEGMPSASLAVIPKILFFGAYGLVFLNFLKRPRTFDSLLYSAFTGYFAYFLFNTGVHENHLFLALILVALLYSDNRKYFADFGLIAVMFNFNLLLFYGLDGKGLPFNRAVLGIDLALLLSIFNLLWFGWLLLDSTLKKARADLGGGDSM
jgi:hypothetical protein